MHARPLLKVVLSGKEAFSSRQRRTRGRQRSVELLEDRQLLSTFDVTNLNNAGPGSLRQAIIESNRQRGTDVIDFQVAGTITVRGSALPSIRDTLTIDGSTAPSFAGSPVVTVDFHGFQGLQFARGADGSVLRSLALVRAGGAGITLNASHVTVQGNDIGLLANGNTLAGNRGDGVRINASSRGDLIGNSNPVSSISYYDASSVSMQPVSGWQGIRASSTPGQYLITGTSSSHGLLYEGPITGVGGTSYAVNVPGATTTSVYGPNNLGGGELQLVGSYKTGNSTVQGFLFQGTAAELSQSGNYRTIDYSGAKLTYVHSTMGGLAVGNADGPEGNLPIGTGHAFLYNIAQSSFTDIVYPGSTSTTAYGIWYNGGTSYTICGGYSMVAGSSGTIGRAYLVNFDLATGQLSNWTTYDYPNGPVGQDFVTHFQGISSTAKGVYTLSADSAQAATSNPSQGSWVTVRLNPDGTFGPATWVDLNFPNTSGITSNDSVIGNQVVGIVIASAGVSSYQATVNIGFQLSNLISGNGGNGIGIYGASGNQIAMNFIGTDSSGTITRGNARNGILVTNRAVGNLIGGQATGGNDPTAGVFVRPPQGNLISGNRGNGVLINQGATRTVLSGNFVGTSASGNSALGNRADGVAIVHANGNQLIGCTFQQDPFVFYNVLSGNGGNGLRVTSSNDTTVQANFMGVGASNATVVANGGDGLLVSGSARNTQVGGVIPLGNVISGNDRNGIEVRDTASGFTSFNTFAGIFAFAGPAPNQLDGILITSRGGNNLIRTCIVSGNLGNGIELAGYARGVQVTETAVGTDTAIQSAMPNQGNGILITGHAHGNAIGGFQPSIEPQVTISSNLGYGIAIVGAAHDNVVYHTYIGTNAQDAADLGNTLGGILLGPGTRSSTLGGTAAPRQNKIVHSLGNGVTIQSSRHNSVLGNQILASQGYGLRALGVCTGSLVRGNLIQANTQGNVNLSGSRGVIYIS